MSTMYARTVDVTIETISRPPDHADLHLLRLALDLQVDAMLLTLGAAAGACDEDPVPWRRWVVEDLDVARLLAQAVLAEGGGRPEALGAGYLGAASETLLDDLVARYASMEDLLADVLGHPYEGQPWRPAAREAWTRCRTRLLELHRYRGTMAARAADRGRSYLPGELLG